MDIGTREPIELDPRRARPGHGAARGLAWRCCAPCCSLASASRCLCWPAAQARRPDRRQPPRPGSRCWSPPRRTRDVPIYLDGLGTVQAFNTVTIKPMVDGPLLDVDFKEGQDVSKGDVLARIDPRTYQAALDKATAKKAQDEAQLANARVDLARYEKLVANNYTSAQQARHAEGAGGPAHGAGAAGPGADRHRAHQPQLHHDHLADRRAHRHPAGRCGQYRARADTTGHRGDHAASADLRAVHPAAAALAGGARQPCTTARRRCWPTHREPAGIRHRARHRHACGAGQSGRSDHRHDQAEGDLPQPGRASCGRAASSACGCRWEPRRAPIVVPPAAVQRGPSGTYVYVVNADNTAARRRRHDQRMRTSRRDRYRWREAG